MDKVTINDLDLTVLPLPVHAPRDSAGRHAHWAALLGQAMGARPTEQLDAGHRDAQPPRRAIPAPATPRELTGRASRWAQGRNFVRRKLDLDPMKRTGGKLRKIDVQKALDFRGLEKMTQRPSVVVILDATPLFDEPAKLSIPTVGVVDSDADPFGVTYSIPANTKSLRFYHTLAYSMVRAVNEGRELRKELESYRKGARGGQGGEQQGR